MSNPPLTLTRLLAERQNQVDFIDQLLGKVETDNRDLVDAERSNIEAARQRITEIDAQVKPIEDFEATRAAHEETRSNVTPTRPRGDRPNAPTGLGIQPREVVYKTAGDFLVDYIRSIRFPDIPSGPDPDAAQRVAAALGRAAGDVAPGVHQTTADTPGLLPQNIVGQVINDLDAARPFVSSIGVLDLAGIPGKKFDRPIITQHTVAGKQTAEKAEGTSGEVKISSIPFSKETYLTWMNISRQEIDWTSPTAWNILIKDMIDVYGIKTEDDAAAAFATAVTQSQAMATDDVAGLIGALYAARTKIVTANGVKRASALRMPNTIWASVDMDDYLGAMIDTHFAALTNPVGDASVTSFGGNVLRLPRIMVPGLPAGTLVMGRKSMTEFYEQRLGILQAIEPKVLGVEVAYGGYAAFGTLDPTAFAKITMAP